MMMNNLMNSHKSQINLPVQLNSTQVRCKEALFARQSCLDISTDTSNSKEVYIPTRGNQETREHMAFHFLLAVQYLVSPQCQDARVMVFICSFMFGLCDNSSGELYLPSSAECRNISGDFFQQKPLSTATNDLNLQLPQCHLLPNTSLDCTGNAYIL